MCGYWGIGVSNKNVILRKQKRTLKSRVKSGFLRSFAVIGFRMTFFYMRRD
jgi:hypothetical protein